MTCSVVFAQEADGQVRAAAAWWQTNRPAAPTLFLDELKMALDMLSASPEVGQRFRRTKVPGVRRLVLRKCRYFVYYLHDPRHSTVYVLAVWGQTRGTNPPLTTPLDKK